jgi:hypothetical protein
MSKNPWRATNTTLPRTNPDLFAVDVARPNGKKLHFIEPTLIIDLRGNTGGGIGALRVMSLLTPGGIPVGSSLPKSHVTPNLDSETQQFLRFGSIPTCKKALWLLALQFAPAMLTKKPIVLQTKSWETRHFTEG